MRHPVQEGPVPTTISTENSRRGASGRSAVSISSPDYSHKHHSDNNGVEGPWQSPTKMMNVKQRRRRYSDTMANSPLHSRRFRDLATTDNTEPWNNKGNVIYLRNETLPMSHGQLFVRPDAITTVNATTAPQNNNSNQELIFDVLMIFLSGLAIIIAMIVMVFAVVILFDRYGRCGLIWSEWLDQLFPDEAMDHDDSDNNYGPAQEDTYGTIAFKARLCGLTTSERRAVMEQAFAKNCTKYPMSITTETLLLTDGDIIAKHLDKATKSTGNFEESSVPTTCVESSSVTSEITSQALAVDLEGGASIEEQEGVASSINSVYSLGKSSRRIPAQINGKTPSTFDEDSVSDFGSEAEMTTDSDNNMTAAGDDTKSHFLQQLRRTETSCAICLGEYGK
jgi:hypothetical protein